MCIFAQNTNNLNTEDYEDIDDSFCAAPCLCTKLQHYTRSECEAETCCEKTVNNDNETSDDDEEAAVEETDNNEANRAGW